eukprot:CAMPEP_0194477234 /NCGR_PEP_ID=MMETSP0253-20130528/1014_1 /TAXON_ID=2966 /ORGANISM="Noctiluca scintillans" /LENGTH=171 /DNA_ID=CAMNT_0039316183 /DNA_START=66 /DNA_END=581 /DNA_ORIENTATION=-
MSDVLASTALHSVPEKGEEEIIDVPEAEKETDVLRQASIKRVLEGVAYYGTVQDIEQGKDSGERLYLVKYTDGDVEHLTADQVRELSCTSEEVSLATQPQVPVASPARNGMVPTRGEAIASESDADVQKRKSTDSVQKDIVKKPASAAKATAKATEKASKASNIMKKPART